jgi:hypothetical protein
MMSTKKKHSQREGQFIGSPVVGDNLGIQGETARIDTKHQGITVEPSNLERAARMVVGKKVTLTIDETNCPGMEPIVVLRAFNDAAVQAQWTSEEINAVLTYALSGDGDHLMAAIRDHCA